MAYGTNAKFEPVREIAFGSIGAAYATIGTPTTNHVRFIRLVNGTDAEVYISTDGVTDHLRLRVNESIPINLSSNKVREDGLFLSAFTQFYAKDVAAATTTGSVWIEVVYAYGGK